MNMKSGTGDDPFADDLDEESDEADSSDATSTTDTPPESTASETGSSDATPGETPSGRPTQSPESRPTASNVASGRSTLPYIYRRDGAKDERDRTVFYLQQHTQEGERDLKNAVEAQLGEEVGKFDVREAAYLVAMAHADEVAAVLREWGYAMDE